MPEVRNDYERTRHEGVGIVVRHGAIGRRSSRLPIALLSWREIRSSSDRDRERVDQWIAEAGIGPLVAAERALSDDDAVHIRDLAYRADLDIGPNGARVVSAERK